MSHLEHRSHQVRPIGHLVNKPVSARGIIAKVEIIKSVNRNHEFGHLVLRNVVVNDTIEFSHIHVRLISKSTKEIIALSKSPHCNHIELLYSGVVETYHRKPISKPDLNINQIAYSSDYTINNIPRIKVIAFFDNGKKEVLELSNISNKKKSKKRKSYYP